MQKIKTIFERDWDGDRTVIDKLIVDFDFANALAKLAIHLARGGLLPQLERKGV